MPRRYRAVTPRRGLAVQGARIGRGFNRAARRTGGTAMAVRTVDLSRTPGYRSTGTGISGRGDDRSAAGEAWALYRSGTVPELKYLVSHLGNALSMVRLVGSDIDPDTGAPTGKLDTSTRWGQLAAQVAHDIAGGPAGQSQLLRRAAANLTIPGRLHIAIIHERGLRANGEPVTQRWLTLSDSEIAEDTDGRKRVLTPEGTWYTLESNIDSLHAIWQPHAEIASQSDSLVLGSIDILTEISLYGQVINSRSRNALLTNGLVRLPAALQVSVPDMHPDARGNALGAPSMIQTDAAPHTIAELIMMQAVAAAEDPSSIEASMPVIVQDGEIGERAAPIEVVNIAPGSAEDYAARRAAAIARWIGITDIPREAIEGYGSSNRWNAWYTGEQFITMHVRPLSTLVADGLTTAVYREALRREGHPAPESVTLWADTTALAAKPDQSEAADAAVAVGALGLDAYRAAKGFSDDDGIDLTTEQGRRDFAYWLVSQNMAALNDPTVAEYLGLPGPLTIPGAARSTPSSGSGSDESTADQRRSTPDTQTTAAIRHVTELQARRRNAR